MLNYQNKKSNRVVLIEINIKKKIYFFVKKKMQIREKKKLGALARPK
jgi:hypothetical protein